MVQAAKAWDGQNQSPAKLITSAALSACPKIPPRGSAKEKEVHEWFWGAGQV